MRKFLMAILLVLVVVTVSGYTILYANGLGISTGRCLVADDGTRFIVLDNSPVRLGEDSQTRFPGIDTGDKLLVIHDGINETYPGSTGVYMCLKIKNGSIFDVPKPALEGMRKLDWISY